MKKLKCSEKIQCTLSAFLADLKTTFWWQTNSWFLALFTSRSKHSDTNNMRALPKCMFLSPHDFCACSFQTCVQTTYKAPDLVIQAQTGCPCMSHALQVHNPKSKANLHCNPSGYNVALSTPFQLIIHDPTFTCYASYLYVLCKPFHNLQLSQSMSATAPETGLTTFTGCHPHTKKWLWLCKWYSKVHFSSICLKWLNLWTTWYQIQNVSGIIMLKPCCTPMDSRLYSSYRRAHGSSWIHWLLKRLMDVGMGGCGWMCLDFDRNPLDLSQFVAKIKKHLQSTS